MSSLYRNHKLKAGYGVELEDIWQKEVFPVKIRIAGVIEYSGRIPDN